MKNCTTKGLTDLAKQQKQVLTKKLQKNRTEGLSKLTSWLKAYGKDKRVRHYTEERTMRLFLQQVLSPDSSCQEVITQHCMSLGGKGTVSSNTAGYCKARQRLQEKQIKACAEELGQAQSKEQSKHWLWYGRRVKLVDGTTLSMPDTDENQAVYPQPASQEKGIGFPRLRWVGLSCLGTGAIVGSAVAACKGKYTGETHLLRQLFNYLTTGDILLGDSYYCSYFILVILRRLGVDAVFELHSSRTADFRQGQRLGKFDHCVTWQKPVRPDWMDETVYEEMMPEEITMREMRVKRGKQNRVLVSTMLDNQRYTKAMITQLYQSRWQIECDFRAIKDVMQMDVLRCKTPDMVRKEIWMHVMGYNLIRHSIAHAALLYKKQPRKLSFKVALQGIRYLFDKTKAQYRVCYESLLDIIAKHPVGNRPNRIEPRLIKRRPKPYRKLREHRLLARIRIIEQWA